MFPLTHRSVSAFSREIDKNSAENRSRGKRGEKFVWRDTIIWEHHRRRRSVPGAAAATPPSPRSTPPPPARHRPPDSREDEEEEEEQVICGLQLPKETFFEFLSFVRSFLFAMSSDTFNTPCLPAHGDERRTQKKKARKGGPRAPVPTVVFPHPTHPKKQNA